MLPLKEMWMVLSLLLLLLLPNITEGQGVVSPLDKPCSLVKCVAPESGGEIFELFRLCFHPQQPQAICCICIPFAFLGAVLCSSQTGSLCQRNLTSTVPTAASEDGDVSSHYIQDINVSKEAEQKVSTCWSIKCWECRSDQDPKCGDPFDNTSYPITDCATKPHKPHLPEIASTMCRKIRQKEDGRWRQVIRRCGSVSEMGVTGVCNQGIDENSVYREECYCSTDGCNVASSYHLSGALALASLLFLATTPFASHHFLLAWRVKFILISWDPPVLKALLPMVMHHDVPWAPESEASQIPLHQQAEGDQESGEL
ncbi:unnamed protein product, partial [Darwinula stevensoni]